MHDLEYIRRRQKLLEKKRKRAAEVEAKEEAIRVAKMKAEAREQEKTAARKKLLKEQQENDRLHERHVKRKQKQAQQKWDDRLDILLAQIKEQSRKQSKLEEIRIIIKKREPSLIELDWDRWLSIDLNKKLALLDFEYALEMFKRDNLMAKRRKRTRGKKKQFNYGLSFTGNDADGARADLVATQFNPHDPDGSGKPLAESGFTVAYWYRPDESYTNSFHISWKVHTNSRFDFGLMDADQPYIGVGPENKKLTTKWETMLSTSGNDDIKSTFLDDDGKILKNGTWMHIAVTYAGTDNPDGDGNMLRKIYVNGRHIYGGFGETKQSVDWTRKADTMVQGVAFGMRAVQASGTDSESGLRNTKYNNGNACGLDEIAFYKEEKDANWVTSVYNGGAGYNHKNSGGNGLVGYWKFSEGKGTTVKDLSGYGHHGTLTNALYGTSIDNAINNLPPSGTPTWIKVPKGYGQ